MLQRGSEITESGGQMILWYHFLKYIKSVLICVDSNFIIIAQEEYKNLQEGLLRYSKAKEISHN